MPPRNLDDREPPQEATQAAPNRVAETERVDPVRGDMPADGAPTGLANSTEFVEASANGHNAHSRPTSGNDRIQVYPKPAEHFSSNKNASPVVPLTVWTPSKLLNYQCPPGQNLIEGGYLRKGEVTTIIGQGGLGKSRLSVWMAVCQITGRPWCGLPASGAPQVWLMVGNENSIARQQDDLTKILANFDDRERALIESHLRVHVLATFEDSLIGVSEPEAKARFRATLEAVKPGVVVIDPFANIVFGDENKTEDVRDTLKALVGVIHSVVPECAILLLHHARTGSFNISQSVGYDAPNFGRGSKVLFAVCRCQINLAPGDAEDERKLVLSCGKSNNGPKFKTRGIIFDVETFEYRVDDDFDLEAWKDDVAGKRAKQSCTILDVVETVRLGVHRTKEIIDSVITSTGCSAPTVKRRLKDACEKGYLQSTVPRGSYTLGPNAEKIKPDH
jgi:hypothetical protein